MEILDKFIASLEKYQYCLQGTEGISKVGLGERRSGRHLSEVERSSGYTA